MKNIVLFGGSNSVMVNGLQRGLKEYANVTNLALGGSSAIQNLYELCRERNQEAIKNADLIVAESNINDIGAIHIKDQSFDNTLIYLRFFFKSLHHLNKPICIIILPLFDKNSVEITYKINNYYKYLINFYGYNSIDLHSYYCNKELNNFANISGDHLAHQMPLIMRNLGKMISKNMFLFNNSYKSITDFELPQFKVITPKEMTQITVGGGV